jgi:hypothetical protein
MFYSCTALVSIILEWAQNKITTITITIIRQGNWQLVSSARFMTRQLFHGRNHPKYQEIEIFHDFLLRISPADIRQFLN